MKNNKNHPKHNLIVVIIGFILIALVTALFFLKSSFSNNKKRQDSTSNQSQEANDNFEYSSISSAALLKKMNEKEDFEILDIRDKDSFLLGHIIDSKNITAENLAQNISSLDKSKQYYIVDEMGSTSLEKDVMSFLLKSGFKNISYLEGGIYNWKNELNPVVEFGNPTSLADQSKVNYISSEDLRKLINEESGALSIVDLRDNNNFIAGHLKNAINIPIDSLESRREEITSYKRIVLYDDTGLFAFQGAARLFDMGVLNVFALSDGLNSWKEKGFELVK